MDFLNDLNFWFGLVVGYGICMVVAVVTLWFYELRKGKKDEREFDGAERSAPSAEADET